MKTLKKYSVKSISETLSVDELKRTTGGYGDLCDPETFCTITCDNGTHMFMIPHGACCEGAYEKCDNPQLGYSCSGWCTDIC